MGQRKLEAAGFHVGTVAEFLGLTDAEMAVIDLHLDLRDLLIAIREREGLTQTELAKRMRSSQSRVAKMERAGSDVSLDLLVKALFAAGADRKDIARAIAPRRR